ncbi:MAG: 2-phospho-L-lactate transferase [Candidatus Heimdallarchaeota archaeon]|nr:2-phospho-L-lactate transferase [Candidatus Heimdallarchaeota archaeon]
MNERQAQVTFLSGGTGTPKLLLGIRKFLQDEQLTVIGNTGDDDEFYGLLVSPDIDTLLYLFSEQLDLTKFWGVKNETFNCLQQIQEQLQMDTWFQLGDKDLALHLFRNKLLTEGYTLTEIVQEIRKRLQIKATILPMSDAPVRTVLTSINGESLSFQEYTVKLREQVAIKNVEYLGATKAKPSPQVLEAILNAKTIIIGPSNPITSINPMLAIAGFRKALEQTTAKIIAVSPIRSGQTFSGPAAKLMQQLGLAPSPQGIAKLYQKFLGTLIISDQDKEQIEQITALGIKTIATNISLATEAARTRLAQIVLEEAEIGRNPC